jgi:hypothetical protein
MASRDTAVYVERTYYAPRDTFYGLSNCVVVRSKVYTGKKGAQSHLSLGSVMDWNIPSDEPTRNTSAISTIADVTYMQGTVHPDSTFAWDNSQRFAAEAMLGWATGAEPHGVDHRNYHGSFGTYRRMTDDHLIAPGVYEPDAQMWWDSVTNYDYNSGNGSDTDQAIWMTYMHDFDLTDSDTLYFWTALVMVKQGSVSYLECTIENAHDWHLGWVRNLSGGCCCFPPTSGDIDQNFTIDITDIALLIDNQFLTLTPLRCDDEGDIDYNGVIDITDLSILIDNQFLTLTPLPPCCPWRTCGE